MSKLKEKKGQALVEFALILPLLLALICGIIDFGWIYANQYRVDNAAYTAARYAVVNREALSDEELTEAVELHVMENLECEAEDVDVDLTIGDQKISVKVTYPIRTLTFVAWGIFGRYYNVKAGSEALA